MTFRPALLLAAALVAGCSSPETRSPSVAAGPAPAAPLAAGWTHHESKTDGFSMDLPSGFTIVDAQQPGYSDILAKVKQGSPVFAQQIEEIGTKRPFALYAMEVDQATQKTGVVSNISVIHRIGGSTPPMNEKTIQQITESITKRMKSAKVNGELVDLPVGQGIRIVMEVEKPGLDGKPTPSRSEAYYLGSGTDTFVINYESADDARAADFRKSIESFRTKF